MQCRVALPKHSATFTLKPVCRPTQTEPTSIDGSRPIAGAGERPVLGSSIRRIATKQCCITLGRRIRHAVLMHKPPVGTGTHHVDIGAGGEVVRVARAHLQIDGHRGGLVDQVMAIVGAFWKCRAITRPQNRLAVVFNERQFAFKQIDELVFVAVPVALTGPAAGWQSSDSRRNREAHPRRPSAAVYAQHKAILMAWWLVCPGCPGLLLRPL